LLNINECILMIKECLKKRNIELTVNLGLPNMNLCEVDLCIDCVSSVLCDEGFNDNYEPNTYGLQLEEVIDYLNHIRYSIVDGVEFAWKV